MSNPDPSSDPFPPLPPLAERALLDSLSEIRQQLALKARIDELKNQLCSDWHIYATARNNGQDTAASPVSALKTEALALISTLKDFHCDIAHQCADAGMHKQAHSMSVDEGMLLSAFSLLASVDCESF